MKKLQAFTLAETLITLGIIGVVAALTLPTLLAKYNEMVAVNKIKRSYSEIANAIEMRKFELGASDYASVFDTSMSAAEQLDGILKYLHVVERCDQFNNGCGGDYKIKPRKRTNDGNGNVSEGRAYFYMERAVLSDGTLVAHSRRAWTGSACTVTYISYKTDENGNYILGDDGNPIIIPYNATSCAELFFDIDVVKGKNQYGYDNYSFNVYPTKLNQHSGYGGLYDVIRTGKLTYENYNVGEKF